ncbi:MAG: Stk1 family PASTA domain-containing Ser/Thr kinase [Solirubrobacteraceae bacterium]
MATVATGSMIDGRYKVTSRLGAGGMADVFLAEDQQLGRQVALKLLHGRFAEDPGFVERFRREARAAAGLQHPHVVSVYDRGSYESTYYIAMEYLPGRTLKRLIGEEAPLAPVRAIDITLQILQAARFAHGRGVIHRDLKPQNVIVDDADLAKVTDFGIARAGASDMTETGSIMGTAQYLSPEQAQGQAVSASSDLYSIGVVLYELLTGRVPFDAEAAVTIAIKHVSEPPTAPTTINPQIPPALEQVVMWALNKDPADRPADADQLIAALEQVKAGILSGAGAEHTVNMPALAAIGPAAAGPAVASASNPPATQPPAPPASADAQRTPSAERGRRRRWLWALLAVLLIAGGAIAAYLLTRPAQKVVPAVVLQPIGTARAEIVNAGFSPRTVNVADQHPAGTVIGQQPLGGTKADVGSAVMLTVSEGAGNKAVPPVKGLSLKVAEQMIRAAGLKVGAVMHLPSGVFAVGKVTDTTPAAGVTPPAGTKVTIFVSSGKPSAGVTPSVPDVTNQTQAAAEAMLQAAGFKVNTSNQTSSTVSPGNVISQDPTGGTNAPAGATVNLVIAQATTTTTTTASTPIPDVKGKTAAAASSELSAAHLNVIERPKDVRMQSKDGIVLSQSPPSGSTANQGATVTIVVGHYTTSTSTTPGAPTTTTTTR